MSSGGCCHEGGSILHNLEGMEDYCLEKWTGADNGSLIE